MNKMMMLLAGALVATTVQAADVKTDNARNMSVTFGVADAKADLATLTQKSWSGFELELGARFAPEGYGVTFQPYLGMGRFGGDKNVADRGVQNPTGLKQQQAGSFWGPNSYAMTFFRGGFDIRIVPTDKLPLTVAFGPSLHQWQAERIGFSSGKFGDSGLKAGWRVGLSYAVNTEWEVNAFYTATDWTTRRDMSAYPGYVNDTVTPSAIRGLNPSQPSYLSLSATYRF